MPCNECEHFACHIERLSEKGELEAALNSKPYGRFLRAAILAPFDKPFPVSFYGPPSDESGPSVGIEIERRVKFKKRIVTRRDSNA